MRGSKVKYIECNKMQLTFRCYDDYNEISIKLGGTTCGL